MTLGLKEVTLNFFEHEEKVVPGNLSTSLFTIKMKGNIDSRCAISKSHCHGTSLSLIQFPSTVNLGEIL